MAETETTSLGDGVRQFFGELFKYDKDEEKYVFYPLGIVFLLIKFYLGAIIVGSISRATRVQLLPSFARAA